MATKTPVILTEEQGTLKKSSNDLATYYDERDKLKAKLAEVLAEIDRIQRDLQNEMDRLDMTSFKTPRGTFSRYSQVFASVVDPDLAFTFLEGQNMGTLIQRKVNSQSLSSEVRKMVDEGTMDLTDFEDLGIKISNREIIRLSGRK